MHCNTLQLTAAHHMSMIDVQAQFGNDLTFEICMEFPGRFGVCEATLRLDQKIPSRS